MKSNITPVAMTVADFSQWARISRTRVYAEIGCGALRIFKLGRRTMIATADAEAWLAERRNARPSGLVSAIEL